MVHGRWPAKYLDHINGIRNDNRLCNLREATQTENTRNQGKQKTNTSGLKGAGWHKGQKKWVAKIRIGTTDKWLGTFSSKEEAHAAYCEAAKKYHGEFANYG